MIVERNGGAVLYLDANFNPVSSDQAVLVRAVTKDGRAYTLANEPTKAQKFNPYHRPGGPGGGQFTSGEEGGGGASATDHPGPTPKAGTEHTAELLPKSVDPSAIPRDPKLSPELKAVETRFAEKLAADPQGAWREYMKLSDRRADTKGGKVLAVDAARELSPEYVADPTLSAAVHEPGSWFIKEAYAARLSQPPGPGENAEVVFTGGGTGAGKTTAIRDCAEGLIDRSMIIYDGNLAGFESSRNKVSAALDAGKRVTILDIDRDPLTAFTAGIFPDGPKGAGVLTRAITSGRTVPVDAHIDTHVKSRATIPRLDKEFSGNPNVEVLYINNNLGGKGTAKIVSHDSLPVPNYKTLRSDLYGALERAHNEGRISDAIYKRTRGEEKLTGD